MTRLSNQLISSTQSQEYSENLSGSQLNPEDAQHELQLSLAALCAIGSIGPVTQKQILDHLKKYRIGWQEFWAGNELFYQEMKLSEKQINSINKFIKEHTIYSYGETLMIRGIRIITYADEEYPPLLTELERAPLVLFGMGEVVRQPDRLSLAVVGARGMTPYGSSVTEQLVMELIEQGVAINSGFMYGVDTTAHQAALRFGGKTIGILGFGFGQMYPDTQLPVFEQCLADGMTFYSPFAPDLPAKKGNFPARNQIVAGMSHGVLVTEAAAHSGSLITAGVAVDLGREVFAVPGPIDSPYSEGTMHLVNQGATLVNSGYDIIEYLRWPPGNIASPRSEARSVGEINRSVSLTGSAKPTSPVFLSSAPQSSMPQAEQLTPSSPQSIQHSKSNRSLHSVVQPTQSDKLSNQSPFKSTQSAGRPFQANRPATRSIISQLDSFDFQLLSKLAKKSLSFDQLCDALACPAPQLSHVLGKLEIEGVVTNIGDSWKIVR